MRLLPSLLLFIVGVAANSQAQDTGYSFVFIPTSIQEVDLAFPLKGNCSTQIDLQTITQGAQLGQNDNPFAYWQRIHFRPWLQYKRHREPSTGLLDKLHKTFRDPSGRFQSVE